MKRSFLAGLVAALLAVLVWGLQFPIAKDTFEIVDPFHVTLVRYGIAVIVLLPVVLWCEGPGALAYAGRAPLTLSMGAIGMSLSPMMVFYGISLTGAEHGAMIVALQPSTMALTQWVVLKRRPSRFTLLCIVVAFLGVVMIVTRGGAALAEASESMLGTVLILAGGLCWVYYTLGSEHLKGWSAWRITVLTMLPGAVTTLLAISLMTGTGLLVAPRLEDYHAVAAKLVFLSVFGVVFGMVAWNFGTRRIGPLNSMLLTNLMPVATFTYRAVQGYRFSRVELAGAAIVMSALIANNVYLRWQFVKNRAAG
jgi:drug/metabolite transporter (DMT)-like permease